MHNNQENAAHSHEEPLKAHTSGAEHKHPSTDETKTASTPRSSNMRSRWKRKGAAAAKPAGSSQSAACGEVDPSAVRETLTTHRREKTAAKEVHHASSVSNKAEKHLRATHNHSEPAEAPHEASAHVTKDDEVFQAPKLHTRHRSQDREKASADALRGRNERSDRSSRERSDRYERPVAARASQSARSPMAPASYRPTTVKPDSLWTRIKGFFGSIFGGSSASRPSTPMVNKGHNSQGRSSNSYGRRPMAGKNSGQPRRRSEGGRGRSS